MVVRLGEEEDEDEDDLEDVTGEDEVEALSDSVVLSEDEEKSVMVGLAVRLASSSSISSVDFPFASLGKVRFDGVVDLNFCC